MHPSVIACPLVGDGIVMVTTSAAAVIEQQSPRKRATSFAIKTSSMFRLVSKFRCQRGLKSLLRDRQFRLSKAGTYSLEAGGRVWEAGPSRLSMNFENGDETVRRSS